MGLAKGRGFSAKRSAGHFAMTASWRTGGCRIVAFGRFRLQPEPGLASLAVRVRRRRLVPASGWPGEFCGRTALGTHWHTVAATGSRASLTRTA